MSHTPEDWRSALGALLPDDYTPESESPEADRPEAGKFPKQRLAVSMERKGRGGKTATIISGFNLSDEEIEQVASILKRRLATGGSARGGEILIQGDRTDDVRRILKEIGLI